MDADQVADDRPATGARQHAELTEADFERLDVLLEAQPGGDAMLVEELDGFLTALACGAEPVGQNEWMAEVLGARQEPGSDGFAQGDIDGDTSGFPAGQDAATAELTALIVRHARQVEHSLAQGRYSPVLGYNEDGEPDGVAWAVGFLRGVELRPESWEAMLAEEQFGDALDAIETLAASLDDDADQAAEFDRRERAALIDQFVADVADIHEFFRPFRQAGTQPQAMRGHTVRHESPKPGRNDPCPCGSGRKFKHCHGR